MPASLMRAGLAGETPVAAFFRPLAGGAAFSSPGSRRQFILKIENIRAKQGLPGAAKNFKWQD